MRSIRWMRDILIIVLMLLFISGVVWADEKEEKYVDWYEIPIQYKYISLKVITKCSGRKVDKANKTYCDIDDIDEQKIFFENLRKRVKKEIVSSAPKEASDFDLKKEELKYFSPPILPYGFGFIDFYENKKGEIFMEISYYNGGNCAQCEYYDLYDDEGNLVATDRDRIYLISTTKKFSEVIKKYRNFKKKLGLKKVRSTFIWLEEKYLKKGGKL